MQRIFRWRKLFPRIFPAVKSLVVDSLRAEMSSFGDWVKGHLRYHDEILDVIN